MKRVVSLALAAVLCLSLLSACGGKQEEKKVDLSAFAQTVLESHEFGAMERADPEDQEVGAIMLSSYYPGLLDVEMEQTQVYLALISFSAGELALVEAKDAGSAAKVQEIFEARVESKSTEGMGNYPEEVEIWQRNARVVSSGNYVMLICHDDADAIVDEFNALFQ